MPVWDKLNELKDALDDSLNKGDGAGAPPAAGHHKDQGEARAEIEREEHDVHKIQEREGWSDKIKDVLDGGEAKRRKEEEEERAKLERIEREKQEAKEKVEAERGVLGKIQDAFDGGAHKKAEEEAEFKRLEQEAQEEERKKHSIAGFAAKIQDALDGPDDQREQKLMEVNKHQREKTQEKESELDLGDKVKKVWDQATGQEKKQPPKSDRGWLAEKLNGMAGGGAASEVNEDKLDKMIDWYQAHVLKQGDQHNESAVEQMKDEQISDGLRAAYKAVTGHNMPVKDKEH